MIQCNYYFSTLVFFFCFYKFIEVRRQHIDNQSKRPKSPLQMRPPAGAPPLPLAVLFDKMQNYQVKTTESFISLNFVFCRMNSIFFVLVGWSESACAQGWSESACAQGWSERAFN